MITRQMFKVNCFWRLSNKHTKVKVNFSSSSNHMTQDSAEKIAFAKKILKKSTVQAVQEDISQATSFGNIKLDMEVKPSHRTLPKRINTNEFPTDGFLQQNSQKLGVANYFDENYFPDTVEESVNISTISTSKSKDQTAKNRQEFDAEPQRGETDSNIYSEDLNYFDQQLFPNQDSSVSSKDKNKHDFNIEDLNIPSTCDVQFLYGKHAKNDINKSDLNYFDEALFQNQNLNENRNEEKYRKHELSHDISADVDIKSYKYRPERWRSNIKSHQHDKKSSDVHSEAGPSTERGEKHEPDAYSVVKEMRRENKSTTQHSSTSKLPGKWTGALDSRGFRILSEQVPDLQWLPQVEVLNILRNAVIYEDDELVAINKPYGLASHGGPHIHNSIGKLLNELRKKIDKNLERIYMIHRLDKEATGVMLFAKNKKCAAKLVEMFKQRQVVKKYLVITKGVPNPEEGVIDIPMCEAKVGGKVRMTLQPYYPKELKADIRISRTRSISSAQEAITNFKVLDSHYNAALVECQPESGVKHQIRCHLAFAMNTPVLGDHKYSHLSKIAPQKLPADILQRLGIRQAKVRHLAMHLHAAKLILPEFRDGRNVFINANLPKHFSQNMKWLKLRFPK